MTYDATPQTQPRLRDRFFGAIRRSGIVRTSDRVIGGVASGLAHRLGISPGIVRIALAIGVVFFGLSLWTYVIAWLLLPDESTGLIPLERVLS